MIWGTPILGNLHMFTMFISNPGGDHRGLAQSYTTCFVGLPARWNDFLRGGHLRTSADICGPAASAMGWVESCCINLYHVLSHGHSRWSWHWIPLRVWNFCRSRLARTRAVSFKECPQFMPTWVLPTLLPQHAKSFFPAYKIYRY